ncbi:DUF4167 domain-containing protein [uncultured Sneathiella sp.]|jgi:hypothetical protein|uniref:DUF4167 domain-containing protein n=1 Tax=uncultured Sneathiella sp. TaxID=879315 RepID=UPI0030DD2D75|tara:strand:+ start:1478 stop:2167 length:690 start_codon:yes stop_codon:yes gene_type:complete
MRVSSNRRPRGGRTNSGGNRPGSGNNRRPGGGNRNYDSNGPDGKIRGTAQQVYDKYVAHGSDAQTSGDRVAAENYFQHAEHYFRIIAANTAIPKEKSASENSDNTGSSESADNQGNSNNAENSAAPSENENNKRPQRKPRSRARDEAVSGDDEKRSDDISKAEIDLSTAEQPVVDMTADGAVSGLSPVAEGEGDEAKPKRKVSRTRTLRRRTSSRNVDENDAEEANTTE